MFLTSEELIERINEIFTTYGYTLCLDYYSWEDDFAYDEVHWIKTKVRAVVRDMEKNSYEIELRDLVQVMCNENLFSLIDFEIKQVFESTGVDIYVLSYVIMSQETGEEFYSFNNVYERY